VEEEGRHLYIRRRNLWSTLSNTKNQHNMPWCIGDFNTTLASHEIRSNFQSTKTDYIRISTLE